MAVRFLLNGRDTEAADERPHVSLLTWLRARGLIGAKEGCAEGECGACAVALGTRDAAGVTHYDAVNSCILPFASVHGRAVITVEGVAPAANTLHPVQQALVDHAGSQCGYCTPGFVISLFCAYHASPNALESSEVVAGNLCRCTGYRPIAAAQAELARSSFQAEKRRLPQLPDTLVASPRSGSAFLAPRTLPEVFEAMARQPQAVLIAGGTDLMVYANQRQQRDACMISLEHVAELRVWTRGADELVIGAGLPLGHIEAHVPPELPLLTQLLPLFSSRLVRARATLGGNLGTASPIGDAPPVLLALDASVTLQSAQGTRRVALSEFFTGYRRTLRAPSELIVSLHVPLTPPLFQRFYKVAKRAADDISTVAAAFALDCDAAGRVVRLRAAFGGVAATPLRAHAVEDLAHGMLWNAATVRVLSEALQPLGTPQDDHRGTAAYRRAMMGRLLQKFFAESASSAKSTAGAAP